MSGYQNAGWLSRLWSLARPGEPTTRFVTNVNLVQDGRYRSSRERAPYGRVLNNTPAPGLGEHAGFELRADDSIGAIKLLHHLRAQTSAGVVIWSLAVPTANLIADRTASTYQFRDNDPDVSLSIFTLSTAVGDLPTPAFPTPMDYDGTNQAIYPYGPNPFAGLWLGPESLYVFCFSADETMLLDAAIQAVRA